MYNWMKTHMQTIPMMLQFFANDGGAGGAGGASGGEGGSGAGEGGAGEGGAAGAAGAGGTGGQKPTFDDLMKDAANQSEFDKRVNKALATAKAKWDADSKLTAEQLAAQKTKEKEDALAAKEKELSVRELKTKAQGILAEKKLPARLANRLDYSGDEDAMLESLKELEEDFRASLQESVNEKLKGNPPPAGGTADPDENKRRAAMGLPPKK